jgi:thiol:disulfide interchange protein DsbC
MVKLLLAVRQSGLLLVALLVLVSASVSAQPVKLSANAPLLEGATEIPKDIEEKIYARLHDARPDLEVSDLRPSPMPNFYKIDLNGQLAFVSADGEFLIAGEMYQVNPGRLVNLQEQERLEQEKAFGPKRAELLAAIDKKDMVIYSPEKETKGHIYVFTDIDCGFCRKLHGQLPEMLNQGIEVRYLAFPRAGIRSRSAQKLETTWCSSDPRETLTQYKAGKAIALDVCDANPVADQYMLGQEIGVRGTPAIVLESGKMIPGAVSPDVLVKEMGI